MLPWCLCSGFRCPVCSRQAAFCLLVQCLTKFCYTTQFLCVHHAPMLQSHHRTAPGYWHSGVNNLACALVNIIDSRQWKGDPCSYGKWAHHEGNCKCNPAIRKCSGQGLGDYSDQIPLSLNWARWCTPLFPAPKRQILVDLWALCQPGLQNEF